MNQRKRRYESVSEDSDSESELFYDEEYLNSSLSSNGINGDNPLADDQESSFDNDFEESLANDEPELFYDEECLNSSLSSNDSDGDIDNPLVDDQESSSDLEESSANLECFEVDSDFESDSDDESDFDAEDGTEHDDDWSWDEAMDDPLAPSTSEGEDDEVMWEDVKPSFAPRKDVPPDEETEVFVDKDSEPYELFFKMFPKELIKWIVICTNERLDILAEKKGKEIQHTDSNEMTLVLGIFLVMAYNRVPHMAMYWSQHPSLGNKAIKNAISRDRFLLLASKIYFNHPKKPRNADKTYYTNVLIKRLVKAFQRARGESTRQAIDETMVKFKGRSIIKQFMPKKNIKRGAKIYTRSCSKTGYCYDMFVYKGKEESKLKGTLGERVVYKLCKSIRGKNVSICTDRFFTSYKMMKKSPFPLVGTCMTNRKNIPTMSDKLQKGESVVKSSVDGVIAFKWQDTKEVTLLSNCHSSDISTVTRKQKDGIKKVVPCPEAIAFYNKYMGGVDMTDQYTLLYDINRKSTKWWKRVFQRLLMTAVTNAWIMHKHLKEKKVSLIDFMIPLAEDLMEIGKSGTKVQRTMKTGRPSKRSKKFVNVQHLPVPSTKRRCRLCASKKFEKRTRFVCLTCEVPLCAGCFLPYHQ